MKGIIGSTTWDDCYKCKHFGEDGCQEKIEVEYNEIYEVIVCTKFEDR